MSTRRTPAGVLASSTRSSASGEVDVLAVERAQLADAQPCEREGRDDRAVARPFALDAYGDPAVIDCSQHRELSAHWLLDGRTRTAYLCAPQDEQQRLRPLFATLIPSVLSDLRLRPWFADRRLRLLVEDHDQHDCDRTLDALRDRPVDRQRGPVDDLAVGQQHAQPGVVE
jgi:hypothetical protein